MAKGQAHWHHLFCPSFCLPGREGQLRSDTPVVTALLPPRPQTTDHAIGVELGVLVRAALPLPPRGEPLAREPVTEGAQKQLLSLSPSRGPF